MYFPDTPVPNTPRWECRAWYYNPCQICCGIGETAHFPTPTWQLISSVPLVSENPTPSSGLHGHWVHVGHRHTWRQNIHSHKNKNKQMFKKQSTWLGWPFTIGPRIIPTILILLHFVIRLRSTYVCYVHSPVFACATVNEDITLVKVLRTKYWVVTPMDTFTKPTKARGSLRKRRQKECPWQNVEGELRNAVFWVWCDCHTHELTGAVVTCNTNHCNTKQTKVCT